MSKTGVPPKKRKRIEDEEEEKRHKVKEEKETDDNEDQEESPKSTKKGDKKGNDITKKRKDDNKTVTKQSNKPKRTKNKSSDNDSDESDDSDSDRTEDRKLSNKRRKISKKKKPSPKNGKKEKDVKTQRKNPRQRTEGRRPRRGKPRQKLPLDFERSCYEQNNPSDITYDEALLAIAERHKVETGIEMDDSTLSKLNGIANVVIRRIIHLACQIRIAHGRSTTITSGCINYGARNVFANDMHKEIYDVVQECVRVARIWFSLKRKKHGNEWYGDRNNEDPDTEINKDAKTSATGTDGEDDSDISQKSTLQEATGLAFNLEHIKSHIEMISVFKSFSKEVPVIVAAYIEGFMAIMIEETYGQANSRITKLRKLKEHGNDTDGESESTKDLKNGYRLIRDPTDTSCKMEYVIPRDILLTQCVNPDLKFVFNSIVISKAGVLPQVYENLFPEAKKTPLRPRRNNTKNQQNGDNVSKLIQIKKSTAGNSNGNASLPPSGNKKAVSFKDSEIIKTSKTVKSLSGTQDSNPSDSNITADYLWS